VSTAADAVIADHPEAQRYEARIGDAMAGDIQYRLRPGLIALNHTEVRERFEGQGLGGQLAAFALDDARARGLEVLPFCPFVNAYLQRHPEYLDLVPQAYRENFDL
jgi:uncharacterized protein